MGGGKRVVSEAAIGGIVLDEVVHLLGRLGAEGHGRDGVRVDEAHDLGTGREKGNEG